MQAADRCCAVCSTLYIAPFLASIGWLSADELKRLKLQSKTNSSFGQQRQRMLPNRSWAPREDLKAGASSAGEDD